MSSWTNTGRRDSFAFSRMAAYKEEQQGILDEKQSQQMWWNVYQIDEDGEEEASTVFRSYLGGLKPRSLWTSYEGFLIHVTRVFQSL